MNLREKFLKLSTEELAAYLAGAKVRMSDKNRMVASAAAHSVRMIENELAKRQHTA